VALSRSPSSSYAPCSLDWQVYPAAWFYWVSYYLVCVLTMVQLVVGAIVSEFLVTQGAGRKQFIVGTTDIHLFAQESCTSLSTCVAFVCL